MTEACLDRFESTGANAGTRPANVAARFAELRQLEIDFIPNSTFGADDEGDERAAEAARRNARVTTAPPADLPAHLRGMCEADLLSHEQEAALFRGMNFYKYRAHALQATLDPAKMDAATLDQISSLLEKSQQLRDCIVQANMRLVISIVKKFVTPQQSFDDMLSDGIFVLMQAVEKFDYDRGFRFSTYAYRSIARHAYRSVMSALKEDARRASDVQEWTFEQSGLAASALGDHVWSNLRSLAGKMLDKLDRRERFIIRCRYALGSHRKVQTCQYLADKLGISKERVRQLELRAVEKMRSMASEFETDELFAAAMV